MSEKLRQKFSSGKKQYIVTLIATLIAMAIIVVYTFETFFILAKEDAVALGEKSVVEQSEHLNNFLLEGIDVLQVTALTLDYMLQRGVTSEQIREFLLEETKKYTDHINSSFTGIYGVFNGEYIDGVGWTPDKDYVPQTRPWYIAASQNKGKPTVVSPYLDAQTGKSMISVSQTLYDGVSTIALDIYLDDIQKMAKDFNVNGEGYGFIIDKSGLVVAHSDSNEHGKNYLSDKDMLDSDMNSLVRKVLNNKEGNINIEIDGEECMAFFKAVQNDWYVVMVAQRSKLFAKVEKNLGNSIVLALIIFGIVAYFCADSYRHRAKAINYAVEKREYQHSLEDRVREQMAEVREQSRKMIRLQENMIEGMATLIESRDGNTGEHVRNAKTYASMIVSYMYENNMYSDEVTKEFVQKLTSAAVLHDVGKIKISDVILNKPGKFTPEEYEEMKKHAAAGGEIVRDIFGKDADIQLVRIAEDIATCHHEKWNGKGYPMGLKEKEIPLSARIMAVADVFDACVSKRVYKNRMTVEETYNVLREEAGTHFDPEIVEIFFKIRPQVEAYLKEIEE